MIHVICSCIDCFTGVIMNSIVRSNHVCSIVLFLLFAMSTLIIAGDKSQSGIPESLQINMNPQSWYQKYKAEQRKLYTGDKPPFYNMGYYSGGRHIDFSLDLKGVGAAILAGSCFRFLYSVSQFGTKLDTMKKSILYPGLAKSGLFWLPGFVAYGCVVSSKNHDFVLHDRDELLRRLYDAQTNGNCLNNPFDR